MINSDKKMNNSYISGQVYTVPIYFCIMEIRRNCISFYSFVSGGDCCEFRHKHREDIQKMKNHTMGSCVEVLKKENLLINRITDRATEKEIRQISCHSDSVCPGTLFICKGSAFRGRYLEEALKKGAVAYVSEREYPEGNSADALLVTDIRRAMAVLAEMFYDYPSRQMRIVGITGTKGKTTTAYYVRSVLDTWLKERGEKQSAILSSIESYDGKKYEPAKLTTPEPLDLQNYLRRAVDAGVRYLTMEVSSQALKFQRIGSMKLDTGVFLNISKDHISPQEHRDFSDYFHSKLKMFSHCRNICVNLDADHAQQILDAAAGAEKIWTFGTVPEADIYGRNIRMEKGRLLFTVRMPGYEGEVQVPMHGIFNAENALAAIAVCCSMGIPADCMIRGLSAVKVKGRMEEYRSKDGNKTVIVDYAHNRLSFQKLFESVQLEYPEQPISVVFGCPGGKAYNRRKDLAQIADRYADKIYLVPDDPGPEKPEEIAAEIGRYIRRKQDKCVYIADRTEAVFRAVREMTDGSILLVLGKGCETTQKYARGTEKCLSDGQSVKEALTLYDREREASA